MKIETKEILNVIDKKLNEIERTPTLMPKHKDMKDYARLQILFIRDYFVLKDKEIAKEKKQ